MAREASAFHGLLVLDKPGGMTSRAVVDRVQRWLPRGTRIGHTGTLDPLATGVLVICVGVATRLTEHVQSMAKTYQAGILLGSRSDTDDADGTIIPVEGVAPPDREAVGRALREFLGVIEQVPPHFSAAKLTGRRAYDLARRGKDVALAPRRVHIHGIDALAYAYPSLDIEVRCGKGTYIRALARDLGERLGCGAYVQTLRRTRVGCFKAEDALAPEADAETARANLLPVAAAVPHLARMCLDETSLARFRQGLAVSAQVVDPPEADDVAVFDDRGELVGLGRFDRETGLLHPEKVLIT
jgi:tRNA pseudouridine55 synthase